MCEQPLFAVGLRHRTRAICDACLWDAAYELIRRVQAACADRHDHDDW